eukprot:14217651-Alexandrium_andersonii.AAC.1
MQEHVYNNAQKVLSQGANRAYAMCARRETNLQEQHDARKSLDRPVGGILERPRATGAPSSAIATKKDITA